MKTRNTYFNSNIFNFFVFFTYILLSSGCIEQINYDVSTEKDRIVISGLITSSFESQVVQVKRSILTGSGNLTNSTPIVNAEVKISSSTNSFTFSHTTDGNYTALFSAIPNEEYVLEVTVGENMYRSSPQKMPQPQPMLNAKSNLIQKQSLNSSGNLVNNQFVSVSLDGNISTNLKVIYRVFGQYEFMEFNPPSTMQKTCYVNDQIDNNTIKLLSANDLRTTAIENYNILEVPFDARFLRLYAFRIFQYTISDASFSYWNKIRQVTNAGENLFDAPPGKIIGNIRNISNPKDEVLGNFTLGATSSTIVFTNMVQLGSVVNDVCQVRFNTARPPICIDCLRIPESSTTKPSYWPQ